jgi:hypothetical protein
MVNGMSVSRALNFKIRVLRGFEIASFVVLPRPILGALGNAPLLGTNAT